jgi:hypothetical protein
MAFLSKKRVTLSRDQSRGHVAAVGSDRRLRIGLACRLLFSTGHPSDIARRPANHPWPRRRPHRTAPTAGPPPPPDTL